MNNGKIAYWRHSDEEVSGETHKSFGYVALCNKATFLRTLEREFNARGTRNWVMARMSITANEKEINAVNQEPNKMVKLTAIHYEVVKRIPLIYKETP